MLVYTWFQSSLVGAASVAFGNRDLVRRPQFRMGVLPLIPVMSNLVHFLLSLPILGIILLLGGSQPSVALLALPLVLIVQFLFTAGLAYLAAAASVFFRDIGHLLEVILSAFFFVTPIFYEVSTDLRPIPRCHDMRRGSVAPMPRHSTMCRLLPFFRTHAASFSAYTPRCRRSAIPAPRSLRG